MNNSEQYGEGVVALDACTTTTEGTTVKMWLKKPIPVFGSNFRIDLLTGFFLPMGMQVAKVKPTFGDGTTLAHFKAIGCTKALPHQVVLILEDNNEEGFKNPSDFNIPFVKFEIEDIPMDGQSEHQTND